MSTVKEEAKAFVSERFDEAQEYADKAWAKIEAGGWLDTLQNVASTGLTIQPVETPNYSYPTIPVGLIDATPPEDPNITVNLPDSVADITLQPVTLTPVTNIPVLNVAAPNLSFDEKPNVEWPDDPGDAPVTNEIDVPDRPTYTLPTAPTIQQIVLPETPQINKPDFDGVAPDLDLIPPGMTFFFNEAEYKSDLETAIIEKLKTDLEQGGTGLGADVETAMWTRARERLRDQYEQSYRQAQQVHERMGWMIPSGSAVSQLQQIQNEHNRALAALNTEISIKQAELAKEHTNVIYSNIFNLLNHSNAIAQRGFEAAKYTQEAHLNVFNAAIAYHNLKLQKFQTIAQVYEIQLRAALLELDIFKGELEGGRIKAEIQGLYVDLYTRQVDAIKTYVQLYQAEMEGARLQADMEKLKIAIYSEKIRAFGMKIDAGTAQYNAYASANQAEATKAQVYSEQVRAHGLAMEAKKTEASMNIAEAQAKIEVNKALIEELKARIARQSAEIEGVTKKADTEARVYGYRVDRYEADVRKGEAEIDGVIKAYDAQLRHEHNVISTELERAKTNRALAIETNKLRVSAVDSGAKILGQMTASALSSVSAGARFDFSGSDRTSKSESISTSINTTTNIHRAAES